MAARILPFRSLVPAGKQVEFAPASGALCDAYGQRSSPKVVTMAHHARSRPSRRTRTPREDRFLPVEQELTQGYVEVAITGLTLGRLADVYAMLLRGVWASCRDNLRSLLRPVVSTEV